MAVPAANGQDAHPGPKPAQSEPIVTDRPDYTESTETVPAGRMQLEGGYTFSRKNADKEHSMGEWLLRIASGPRLEMRVGMNSFCRDETPSSTTTGFEDMTLGFKYRLAEKSERFNLLKPSISVIGMTSIPTGSPAMREKHLQPEAKLCMGWEPTDKLEATANVNYLYASEGGDQFSQYAASLSVGYALSARTGAYVEYFGFFPDSRGSGNSAYVNTGLSYLFTRDFQVDIRFGQGMNGANPDHFWGFGIARRW